MQRIIAAILTLALAACTTDMPPPREVQPISFNGTHYRFNASRVDVVDDYAGAADKKTPLAAAMHKWAEARLSAGGNVNILEVHITDAAIARKELPKQKTGLEGMFTTEQTEELDGKLTVEIRLYTPDRTLPIAHAEITAEQCHTLAEDASVFDRKAMERQITAEIMQQMDGALDRNIHTYFSNYLL